MSSALGQCYGYLPPVDRLLTLGDPREGDKPDYLSLGLRPEDLPALIRLAGDDALWVADGEEVEVWAPVHAWRALGALRATEAIGPLIALLSNPDPDDFDDWVGDEFPAIFAGLGPDAVPPLAAYLRAPGHGLWARVTAATSLGEVAKDAPEVRGQVVGILQAVLEDTLGRRRPSTEQEETLHGFIISELIDLRAGEAAPTIERAFAADRVDETIAGDLEDVQIALGLRERRDTPARNYFRESFAGHDDDQLDADADRATPPPNRPLDPFAIDAPAPTVRRAEAERKAKSKRKQANQSRKQNRQTGKKK